MPTIFTEDELNIETKPKNIFTEDELDQEVKTSDKNIFTEDELNGVVEEPKPPVEPKKIQTPDLAGNIETGVKPSPTETPDLAWTPPEDYQTKKPQDFPKLTGPESGYELSMYKKEPDLSKLSWETPKPISEPSKPVDIMTSPLTSPTMGYNKPTDQVSPLQQYEEQKSMEAMEYVRSMPSAIENKLLKSLISVDLEITPEDSLMKKGAKAAGGITRDAAIAGLLELNGVSKVLLGKDLNIDPLAIDTIRNMGINPEIADVAGQIAGGLALLSGVSSAMNSFKIPERIASQFYRNPTLVRYLAPAAQFGAVVGGAGTVQEGIRQIASGEIDLTQLGKSAIGSTAWGVGAGLTGGLSNPMLRIAGAGAYGFGTTFLRTKDLTQSTIDGAVLALFTAASSKGITRSQKEGAYNAAKRNVRMAAEMEARKLGYPEDVIKDIGSQAEFMATKKLADLGGIEKVDIKNAEKFSKDIYNDIVGKIKEYGVKPPAAEPAPPKPTPKQITEKITPEAVKPTEKPVEPTKPMVFETTDGKKITIEDVKPQIPEKTPQTPEISMIVEKQAEVPEIKETPLESKPAKPEADLVEEAALKIYKDAYSIDSIDIVPTVLRSGNDGFKMSFKMKNGEVIEHLTRRTKEELESIVKKWINSPVAEHGKKLGVEPGVKWVDLVDNKEELQKEKVKQDEMQKEYNQEQYIRQQFNKTTAKVSELELRKKQGLPVDEKELKSAKEKMDKAVKNYNEFYKKPEAKPIEPSAKEPWEMTQDEYLKSMAKDKYEELKESFGRGGVVWHPFTKAKAQHHVEVLDAIAEGKTIPAEVLKDYPDLEPKPAVEGGGKVTVYRGTRDSEKRFAGEHYSEDKSFAEKFGNVKEHKIDTSKVLDLTDINTVKNLFGEDVAKSFESGDFWKSMPDKQGFTSKPIDKVATYAKEKGFSGIKYIENYSKDTKPTNYLMLDKLSKPAVEGGEAPKSPKAPEPARERKKIPAGKYPLKAQSNIDVIKSVTPKKTSLPILQLSKVDSAGNLMATDLETGIKLYKSGLEKGLYKIIGKDFVKSNMSIDEFPLDVEVKTELGTVDRGEFVTNLERASRDVSTDETRAILKSVLLDVEKGKTSIVSTDGRRLSLSTIESDLPDGKYLISNPAKIAKLLRSVGGEELKIFKDKDKNFIRFVGKDGEVFSSGFEGDFPNYKQILPKPVESLSIDKKDITNALRELMPYFKESKNYTVKLTIGDKEITLSNQGDNIKEVKIPITKSSGFRFEQGNIVMPMTAPEGVTDALNVIRLNSDYLLDALKGVSSDVVNIGIAGQKQPIAITGESKPLEKSRQKSYTVKAKEAEYDNNVESLRGNPGKIQGSPLEVKYEKTKSLSFPKTEIISPSDVAFSFQFLKNEGKEHFFMLGIKNGKPISVELVHIGTINQSVVSLFEPLNLLLSKEADGYMLVHNHPPGSVAPSKEDMTLSRAFDSTYKKHGLEYKGHIIINDVEFGFIDNNFQPSKQTYPTGIKNVRKIPVYQMYLKWNTSKTGLTKISDTDDAFELFKGITTKSDNDIIVVYATEGSRVHSVEVMPERNLDTKNIVATAVKLRTPRIFLAGKKLEPITANLLQNELVNYEMEVTDAIKLVDDKNFISYRGSGELNMEPKRMIRTPKEEYGRQPDLFEDMGAEKPAVEGEPEVDYFMPEKPRYGEKRDRFEKHFDSKDYKVTPARMPELYQMVKQLLGDDITLRKFQRALGAFYSSADPAIKLDPALFQKGNEELLMKVMIHELGHLIDFLPEGTMRRGNILGRVATLKDYLKKLLPEYKGAPEGLITEDDRKRFRKEARAELKEEKAKGTYEIIEEITREIPIFEDSTGLNADDILAVFNDLEGGTKFPELTEYIKRLGGDRTAIGNILRKAMQGIVDEKIAESMGKKQVGTRIEKEKVKRIIIPEDVTESSIAARFKKKLYEEILKRKLFQEQVIREELKTLSKQWTPFNTQTDSNYTQYRFSSKELYADALSAMISNTELVKQIAPTFHKAFWNYIESKPEVKMALEELDHILNGMTEDQIMASREANIENMFEKGDEKLVEILEKEGRPKLSIKERLKIALLNVNAPIIEKIEKAELKNGITVPPKNNPKYTLDEMEFPGYEALFAEVDTKVFQPLVEAGMDFKDFGKFVFLRRIARGDRGDLANPLAYAPDTAEALRKYLNKKYGPEKIAVMEQAIKDYHEIKFKVVEEAVEVGTYNKQKFEELIKPNKDNYVAFAVIEHLQKHMSAMIKAQFGTTKGIINPFISDMLKTMSLMKLNSIQKAKNSIVYTLKTFYPSEIKQTRSTGWGPSKKFHVEKGYAELEVLENGRLNSYDVAPEIARSFEYGSPVDHWALSLLRGALINKVFRTFYITYNLSFGLVTNPIRDLRNSYAALAGFKAGRPMLPIPTLKDFFRWASGKPHLRSLVREYWLGAKTAKRMLKGEIDDEIQAILDGKFLNIPLLGMYKDVQDPVTAVLQKFKFIDGKQQPTNLLLKTVNHILNWVKFQNAAREWGTKIAGYNILKDCEGLSPEEVRYIVNNFIGTPDWRKAGLWKPVTNELLLFSNVAAQGLDNNYQLATNPKTRSGYWWARFKMDIVPTLLKWAAMTGLFGAVLKEAFDMISEYDKVNYDCFPLFFYVNQKGTKKIVYLRIPKDEAGRFVSALQIQALRTMQGEFDLREFMNIFTNIGAGVMPSPAPMFDMYSAWFTYGTGRQPTEPMGGRTIIPDKIMRAGEPFKSRKMLKWSMDQLGVTSFNKYSDSDRDTLENILKNTPGLNRLIAISDVGLGQKQRKTMRDINAIKYKKTILKQDALGELD